MSTQKNNRSITKLRKIEISKFRGLENITINLADRITLICGKNGTSKSTLLGIAAQIFNFDKDYSNDNSLRSSFKTIHNKPFKSQFSEHFRLSSKYDPAGNMNVNVVVYDGYENKEISARLTSTAHSDRSHRMVLRQETGKSRNFTHPVIFLSLKRLLPIAERNKYDIDQTIGFFSDDNNKQTFTRLCNEILLRTNRQSVSCTTGDINSSVAHGDNYDAESVSVGEDNVGQIVSALLSFRKLKDELGENYHGGLLLIDEADAGLFPAAQLKMLDRLNEFSTKYNLQVIVTTHSPILMNKVFEFHKKAPSQHSLCYLTDTTGSITLEENKSWEWIENDILVRSNSTNSREKIPKIDLYFEDEQAYNLFNTLTYRSKFKKFININRKLTIGHGELLALAKLSNKLNHHVMVVVDGDVRPKLNSSTPANIIALPTTLAPDQLLFWLLLRKPADAEYWRNNNQQTRQVIISNNSGDRIINELFEGCDIAGMTLSNFEKLMKKCYKNNKLEGKIRHYFKDFSKGTDVISLVSHNSTNPYREYFIAEAEKDKNDFLEKLEQGLVFMLKNQLHLTEEDVKKMLNQ